MSLEGEMMKCSSEFARNLRMLTEQTMTDRHGNVKGTQKLWGYVCGIHMDNENDDNYGTIDVQEYNYHPSDGVGSGFHENVLISAIQNNKNGMLIVPCMYSDVMIQQDALANIEYVVMVSHVDLIQMRSHEAVEIGVVETEKFVEGEDGDDVPDLKETGKYAKTTYDKDTIQHDVQGHKVTMTKDKIVHGEGNEPMVMGDTLKGVLEELCSAITSLTVTTPHGPSSTPLNAASFNSISKRLKTILSEKSYLD